MEGVSRGTKGSSFGGSGEFCKGMPLFGKGRGGGGWVCFQTQAVKCGSKGVKFATEQTGCLARLIQGKMKPQQQNDRAEVKGMCTAGLRILRLATPKSLCQSAFMSSIIPEAVTAAGQHLAGSIVSKHGDHLHLQPFNEQRDWTFSLDLFR